MVRRAIPVALAAACLLAGGCGNDRTKAPDVMTPGPSLGSEPVNLPDLGLSFLAPAGWNLDRGKPPLVATIATGQATIAIWRYPRSEALPKTKAELELARKALLEAAKTRDPTFTEIKSSATKVAGLPAVQIRARETIESQPRVVRSTHIYAYGGEVVVDAYAAADDFRRVDAEVFRPLLRSLKVTAPASG